MAGDKLSTSSRFLDIPGYSLGELSNCLHPPVYPKFLTQPLSPRINSVLETHRISGDACVPLQSAHLEGAEQITLEGVFHSIDKPNDWYGAERVVDRWLSSVFRELRSPSKGGVTFPELFSTSLSKLFR